MEKLTSEILKTLKVGDALVIGKPMDGLTDEELRWNVTKITDKLTHFRVTWFGIRIMDTVCKANGKKITWREV